MQLRDILVRLDGGVGDRGRLLIASDLATRHDAHLAGLFVADRTPRLWAGASVGFMVAPEAIMLMADGIEAAVASAMRSAEASFRDAQLRCGFRGEWRVAEGTPGPVLALHARYADLTVVGLDDPRVDGFPDLLDVAETVVFDSGRPVLVVPTSYGGASVGHRVVVAWDASRAAARAVNDALPLIRTAGATTIVTAAPIGTFAGVADWKDPEIAVHLARHDLQVTTAGLEAEPGREADALLDHAVRSGADLLVTGAYGHSRLRELVLGGMTRQLLHRPVLPMLMSH